MPGSPMSASVALRPERARSSASSICCRSRSRPSSMGEKTRWPPDARPVGARVRSPTDRKTRTQEVHMSTVEQTVEVDGDKLMQFVFRAVDEVGATLNAALVVMGDKLGLYRALAGAGLLSPAELA